MTAFNEGERPKGGGPWLIWGIPLVLSLCGLVMIASLSLRDRKSTRLNSSHLR